MKRIVILLVGVLCLLSCNKVDPAQNGVYIDDALVMKLSTATTIAGKSFYLNEEPALAGSLSPGRGDVFIIDAGDVVDIYGYWLMGDQGLDAVKTSHFKKLSYSDGYLIVSVTGVLESGRTFRISYAGEALLLRYAWKAESE